MERGGEEMTGKKLCGKNSRRKYFERNGEDRQIKKEETIEIERRRNYR